MKSPDTPVDLKAFQKRYLLSNKDMAAVCQCSLPTIQKWRSGEVAPPGPARQLMRVLDGGAKGDPRRLREILHDRNHDLQVPDPELSSLESSMTQVVDRLELMLESRRKERQLAESEARYRSMLESQNSPVCRWLPDTTITYANAAYADLYGRPGETLIGRKWIEFVPESRRNDVLTLISDVVRRGEPETMVHESIDRDGNLVAAEWRDMPIRDERGEVNELHSIGRDVTELVQLRAQVAELDRIREALMGLCEHPVVIFDEAGRVREANPRFRARFSGGKKSCQLSELVPEMAQNRFKRLLHRLSGDNQVLYRIRVDDKVMSLKVRLLGEGFPGQRYLGILDEETPDVPSSSALRVRLAREIVIEGAPVRFLIDKRTRQRVEREMAALGQQTRVDRIHVFTRDPESGLFDNVLEWCAPGIEPQISGLKGVPIEDYTWWMRHLKRDQIIRVEDVERMPRTASAESEVLSAQGIRSVLACPLRVAGKLIGFAGFDQNRHVRVWHAQELDALTGFKHLIEPVLEQVYRRAD
jgi:PAS domain S-box-containing protein